jgi:ketosteroid isomerase-like protein
VAGARRVRGDRPLTPEQVVQAYLVAWDAGDDAAAWASFSTRVHGLISEADYRTEAAMVRAGSVAANRARRAFFDVATVTGDTASVRVTVEVTAIGGVNADRYRTTSVLMGLDPWGFRKY